MRYNPWMNKPCQKGLLHVHWPTFLPTQFAIQLAPHTLPHMMFTNTNQDPSEFSGPISNSDLLGRRLRLISIFHPSSKFVHFFLHCIEEYGVYQSSVSNHFRRICNSQPREDHLRFQTDRCRKEI